MLNCRLVVDVGSDFDSLNFAPFRLPYSERHIGVPSGQDRMTFFVSQAQPGLGRCYLRTSFKQASA